MRRKLEWFKRTLLGYSVVFVGVDVTNTVIHRPFREPIMKSTKTSKSLRGRSYSMIVFDEYVEEQS